MKKNILLGCLLVLSFNCFSQKGQKSIGLITGAEYIFPRVVNGFEFGDNVTFSVLPPSFGAFFNWDLSNRFGIGLAAKYQYRTREFECPECRDFPTNHAKWEYADLEIPLNLAVNLNKNQVASWRSYFTGGYTFSRLMEIKYTNLTTGEESFPLRNDNSFNRNSNSWTAGYEVRHNLNVKYMLALSPYVRRVFSNGERFIYAGFQVKFGKLL